MMTLLITVKALLKKLILIINLMQVILFKIKIYLLSIDLLLEEEVAVLEIIFKT